MPHNKRAGMCCLVLASAPKPAYLPAIATALELSETMAGNILRTLVAEGVLKRDGIDVFPCHLERVQVIAQSDADYYLETVLRPARQDPPTLDHPGRPLKSVAGAPADPKARIALTDHAHNAPVSLSLHTAPPSDSDSSRTRRIGQRDPAKASGRMWDASQLDGSRASAYPAPGPVRADVPLPRARAGRPPGDDLWGFEGLTMIGMSRTVTADASQVREIVKKLHNAGRAWARYHDGFAVSVRVLPDGTIGYWRVVRAARQKHLRGEAKTAGNGAHP